MKRTQLWMALIALLVSAEVSLLAADTPEPVVVMKKSGPLVFQIETEEINQGDKLIKFPVLKETSTGISLIQESGSFDISFVEQRSEARKAFAILLVSEFLEFDLDFEGGTWEQLSQVLVEKLHEAYKTQLPSIAKDFMPEKLEIAFGAAVDAKLVPRLGAIRKKACTLSGLPFPMGTETGPFRTQLELTEPLDAAILRARALNIENATLKFDSRAFPKISIKAPELIDLNTVYFNLNELPQRPNTTVEKAAADLAALFEISWKLNSPLVFAKTRLHPETGMMILQGSSEEIKVAQEAFSVLTGKKPEKPTSFDVLAEKLGGMVEVLQRREEAKEAREKAALEAKKEREQAALEAKAEREEAELEAKNAREKAAQDAKDKEETKNLGDNKKAEF